MGSQHGQTSCIKQIARYSVAVEMNSGHFSTCPAIRVRSNCSVGTADTSSRWSRYLLLQVALLKLCTITHCQRQSLLDHRESKPNAVCTQAWLCCIWEAMCTVSVSKADNVTCCVKSVELTARQPVTRASTTHEELSWRIRQ